MGLLARILRIVAPPPADAPPAWRVEGDGLLLPFPAADDPRLHRDALLSLRRIALLQMLEGGEAEDRDGDVVVSGDVLCALDGDSRDLLGLPHAWPDGFELETRGQSARTDFSVALLARRRGRARAIPCSLDGPLLKADGGTWLPDGPQRLALRAVAEHAALPPEDRTEAANLRLIRDLQEARQQGLDVDLRHFADMPVRTPERVAVSLAETDDGGLILSPDVGLDLPQGEVNRRLGRLDGSGRTSALRIGRIIVLLDGPHMDAVRDIRAHRRIPAAEKRNFLKNPAAWLDADLVDLDAGFSIRVHGAEIFRKAYFGQDAASPTAWFETDEAGDRVLLPGECLSFLEDEAHLDALENAVRAAMARGAAFVEFEERTVLLPEDAREADAVFAGMREKIRARGRVVERVVEESPPIAVKIDLHDEYMPETADTTPVTAAAHAPYAGDLHEEDLRRTLYEHQRQGARWILGLMPEPGRAASPAVRPGGLLADDMGLGKTLTVLTALNVQMRRMRAAGRLKPILAVMPVVLLENWLGEVEKAFHRPPFRDIVVLQAGADLPRFRLAGAGRETSLRAAVHSGGDAPAGIRRSLRVGPEFGADRLDVPGRLVLANYDTLRDYQFSLCMADWGCVIFDEAQEIRNPNALKSRAAKGLKADFRLAVTGTPVENSLTDFWSVSDTILPGLLSSYQDFRRRYVAPAGATDDLRADLGRELRRAVGHFMLRRTKEDHLPDLPPKHIHDGAEDIRCRGVMRGIQLERYDAVLRRVADVRRAKDVPRLRQMLLPSLKRLRDISLHPALADGGEPAPCTSAAEADAALRLSAKLALLPDILREIQSRNEKAVLFVINRKLQRFLSQSLAVLCGLPSIPIINGDTAAVSGPGSRGGEGRMAIIRRFEEREGFNLICMSPLAAGVGLTIAGANHVIHVERHWNPAREAQATDRVHRIGARKDVHVWLPLAAHPKRRSFDDNLAALLRRKTDLRDAVMVEGDLRQEDFDMDAMFGADA